MILSLFALIPLLAFSVWAFFRVTPSGSWRAMRWYNGSAIVVGVLLCVGWSVRTYHQMVGTVDGPWWPVVSALGSMVIFLGWLMFAAVLRHFLFPQARTSGPVEGP